MFYCRKRIPDPRHSRIRVTDNVEASFMIRVVFCSIQLSDTRVKMRVFTFTSTDVQVGMSVSGTL